MLFGENKLVLFGCRFVWYFCCDANFVFGGGILIKESNCLCFFLVSKIKIV